MDPSSTDSQPDKRPSSSNSSAQSVGVLDFNQFTSDSPSRSPTQPRLPIFHFHSYGTSGDVDKPATPPLTASAPPATSFTEFPDGIFYIKSALNGNVLDVRGGSRKV
jgi:hypothetical protein